MGRGFLASLALALAACSGGRPLDYTEDPPAPVDSSRLLQERLQRALDSLERERCKPPTCYPDPKPPAPP
jgi:hypothetical protein